MKIIKKSDIAKFKKCNGAVNLPSCASLRWSCTLFLPKRRCSSRDNACTSHASCSRSFHDTPRRFVKGSSGILNICLWGCHVTFCVRQRAGCANTCLFGSAKVRSATYLHQKRTHPRRIKDGCKVTRDKKIARTLILVPGEDPAKKPPPASRMQHFQTKVEASPAQLLVYFPTPPFTTKWT